MIQTEERLMSEHKRDLNGKKLHLFLSDFAILLFELLFQKYFIINLK